MPALEDFGIPWLALVDGDHRTANAVTHWEERLGRSLDDQTELVRLADGEGLEKLLIHAGQQEQIAEGLRSCDAETLDDVARRKGLEARHDDVLLRVLRGMKGTYGTPVAMAIVEHTDDDGRPVMPDAVRELLQRADPILGTTW